jgi:hypothetical protein
MYENEKHELFEEMMNNRRELVKSLFPQITEAKTIITVWQRRDDDFLVRIEGQPNFWSHGYTQEEAVNEFVSKYHIGNFELEINKSFYKPGISRIGQIKTSRELKDCKNVQ